MNRAYSRINWENYPSEKTPVNEANLNKIDSFCNTADERIVSLSITKLDLETANSMVKSISFDENTGVITITNLNGTAYQIDTKLEKIAVNFSYNYESETLDITLIDGTVQSVDLSKLITVYEFLESDEIYFAVNESGKVTAHIKDGSITAEKLQPNFLADVTLQADRAESEASEATTQKSLATMEADRAKTEADRAESYSSIVAPGFYFDVDTMTLYQKFGVGVDFIVTEDNVLCWKIS